jgi:hypothetical protein
MHVVRVAGGVLQLAIRLGADNGLRFVGDAPANQAIGIEYRDFLELATGRITIDPYVAGVAAAGEGIVFVELAWMYFIFAVINLACGGRRSGRSGCRCRCRGSRWCTFLVASGQTELQAGAGEPGIGGLVEELAAPLVFGGCL